MQVTSRARKRSRTAAPKSDQTVVQLSAKSKAIIGSSFGAAIGSFIGGLFAEDPDKFMKAAQEAIKLVSIKGIPLTPTSPRMWWGELRPGLWYAVPQDGKEHAFAVVRPGEDVGASACGLLYLKELPDLASTNDRCEICETYLKLAGYTLSKDAATPPTPQPAPPPPPPKRAKKSKTA
jgi:hypothetical protein